MRSIIVSLLFLAASSAQASFYQVSCSNPSGTVKRTSGHVSNMITLEINNYNNGKSSTVKIPESQATVRVIEKGKPLYESGSNTCDSKQTQQRRGVAEWKVGSYMRVAITKKDGSTFSKYADGVSTDLKSIQADFICETNGNSMVLCPK